MREKYIGIMIKIIVAILFLLIPFISINSSDFNINKNKYDKIIIDAEDPSELIIIEGKDKLIEFCNKNSVEKVPKYISFNQLSGKNPIKILTRYKKGIPNNYIFELYGEFEMSSSNTIMFKVEEWNNIGNDKLILLDTIYMRDYHIIILIILLLAFCIKSYKIRFQNR